MCVEINDVAFVLLLHYQKRPRSDRQYKHEAAASGFMMIRSHSLAFFVCIQKTNVQHQN